MTNTEFEIVNHRHEDLTPFMETIKLVKKYDDEIVALQDVSLKVFPGEIYSVLGGNGAGKTTMINIFLNFVEPTSGAAFINGKETHKYPLDVKKEIAYVSENVMLYPSLTALQNLDFFTKIGGHHQYSYTDYEKVLDRVGLQRSAHDKKLKGFSKGMRQKCGIAIAILKNANAIILDEPTSGLDPKAGLEFLTLLKDLRSEGKAILMATHDIFRAKEISDVIGIMNNGKLVFQQTTDKLSSVNLEELYIEYMVGYQEPVQQFQSTTEIE